MAKPILAYWDVRGLAEPIRYLLHFKGVDFEDKRYKRESDDVSRNKINLEQGYYFGSEDWLKDKFNLGLDFPNLPYYIEGEVRITQSTAILRYLARKHGLVGKTEEEKIRVELAEQQLTDFRYEFFHVTMNEDVEHINSEFLNSIPVQAQQFENFLGDRRFMAGDEVTYVDFMAYDTFDFYRYLSPRFLDEFPKLKSYQKRLAKLEKLQSYFSSDRYRTWPIGSPTAKFGGKGSEPKRESL